ncbi:3'-5' exoribonuclease 1-like [Lytechinus variegatus]|uniref:3'-5' exoribonuclease 1-like n=1 Tax=Lytechinus variegatus TaxID=7654 RepID=UPI001BB1A5BC|nr:3'-5' exoribonuclease 1-like [Lytechinus variegatus]
MIVLDYVLILGSVIVVSCFIWISFAMNSSPSTAELQAPDKGHSPSRRNRRGRKLRQTPPASSAPQESQSTNVRHRRTRLADSNDTVEMHIDDPPLPEENMDIDDDDVECEYGVQNTMSKTRIKEGREKKRRKENESLLVTKKDSSPVRLKDFSHPIYKEMSLRNGSVNRMTKIDLQNTLQELGLNRLGSADVLKRRLKHHYSKESLKMAGLSTDVPVRFDYLCVIDVEATCLEINPVDYVHEIIEFPIVLLNTKTLQIEDTFDAFCKPVVNPQLSKFCSQLTNISQKMVDKADTFPVVLEKAERWMKQKGLGSKHSFAIATDCSLDMDLYLKLQCLVSEITYPQYAKEWVNISKVFANLYKTKRLPLRAMLNSIGLAFIGQPHRGIDDARNIARIALQLIEDGAEMKYNEKLTAS